MSVVLNQTHDVTTCGVCGVQFTIPQFLHETRSKNGSSVYCPNGHQLTIPAPDVVVNLKRDMEVIKRQRDENFQAWETEHKLNEELNACIRRLHGRVASLRGHITMFKRKLKAKG